MVWNYICVRVLSVCHLLWIHTQSEAGNHPPLRKCFKNWQIHHPYFPQTSSRIEVPECRHQCPRTSNFPHTSPDPVRVGILWLQMGRVGPGTLFELHIATIISKFLENYKTCQAMPCHAMPCHASSSSSSSGSSWRQWNQSLLARMCPGFEKQGSPWTPTVPGSWNLPSTASSSSWTWANPLTTDQCMAQSNQNYPRENSAIYLGLFDFDLFVNFLKGEKARRGVVSAKKQDVGDIFGCYFLFFGVHNFWVLKACEWPTMPAIWVLVCFDWIVSRIACTIGISLPFACFNGYKTKKKILILHDRKTPHVNFFQQVTQERWIRRNGKGRKETWDGESYVWKTCVW